MNVSEEINVAEETPLDRAQAKREQIERELRKCPDFQLYLLTKSRKERARMERLLMEIPNFRLWRTLGTSIEQALRRRQRRQQEPRWRYEERKGPLSLLLMAEMADAGE